MFSYFRFLIFGLKDIPPEVGEIDGGYGHGLWFFLVNILDGRGFAKLGMAFTVNPLNENRIKSN